VSLIRSAALLLVLRAGAAGASALVIPETEDAREVANEVAAELTQAKVSAKVAAAGTPPLACMSVASEMRRDCAIDAAVGVDAVVIISSAAVQGRLALSIEAIWRRTRKTFVEDAARGTPDQIGTMLHDPVARIVALLRPKPAPAKIVTAPTEPEPTPAPEPSPDAPIAAPVLTPRPQAAPTPVLEEEPPEPPQRAIAITVTSVAAAAVASAIGFGILSSLEGSRLNANVNGVSPLSYSQAQGLRSQTNLHQGIAIGSGVGGALGAAISAWLWTRLPQVRAPREAAFSRSPIAAWSVFPDSFRPISDWASSPAATSRPRSTPVFTPIPSSM